MTKDNPPLKYRFRVTIEILNSAEIIGIDENISVSGEGPGFWPSLDWLRAFYNQGRTKLAHDLETAAKNTGIL